MMESSWALGNLGLNLAPASATVSGHLGWVPQPPWAPASSEDRADADHLTRLLWGIRPQDANCPAAGALSVNGG